MPTVTLSPSTATQTPSAFLNQPIASNSAAVIASQKTITINQNDLGFLRVRSGPNTSYPEVGQVGLGLNFPVEQEQSGWYLIDYQPGQVGWVSGDYVTPH